MGRNFFHRILIPVLFQLFHCFQKFVIAIIFTCISHLNLERIKILLQIHFQLNSQRSMKKLAKKISIEQQKISAPISEQNFKIYLRIKPSHHEQTNHILKIINHNKVQIATPYYSLNEHDRVYSYEQVFDDSFNNHRVFHSTMITPIGNALQGFNSTVFIYGMTGSGKTYTMFGKSGSNTAKGIKTDEDGLVSMTIDYLFNQLEKESHIKSQVCVSFYEIYNQNIRDLLQEQQFPLTIMEDPIRGVFVNGLLEIAAEDKNHLKDTIFSGIQRRSMNATKFNQVSSRSHAILQFLVRRYINNGQLDSTVLQSKFFMIDLAGNEKTSNNQSRRFIEGVNINKSLLTLGKCLSILAQKKSAFVPFRDSKLTRILKESLGGNSKTVMIACVSSERKFYQQTLNTLKYSTIARKIKNRGVKNNIKIVSRDQIGQLGTILGNRNQTHPIQGEGKIKSILSSFLNAVENKLKIERLQQDLEISRRQNEQLLHLDNIDQEACRKNIKKINLTLQMLSKPYEKYIEKVQSIYQEIMQNIQEIVKTMLLQQQSSNIEKNEIIRLKQLISEQNKKIEQYQLKLSNFNSTNHVESLSQQFQTLGNRSIEARKDLKICTPILHKDSSSTSLTIKNSSALRSQSKNKKLSINISENQETYRSSGLQNLSVSNLSNNSKFDRRSNRFQKQIVINLNSQLGEKKSVENSHYSSKQEFVKKLKQTEKKAKGVESEQISNLLKQHEVNRYDLGNVQLSMIRKLKFFQREKSLEKSNSLGKIVAKGHENTRVNIRKY